MSDVNCLNPWDCQSKRIYDVNGAYRTLDAGNAVGGQAHGIVYAIEGNTVDRASSKNGRGWCENVSPTLNTQDRHAVIYDESSITSRVNGSNPKYGDPCHTLHTDSRNIVVISIEGNGARPSHLGGGYSESGKSFTLNTIERHSVCYSLDAISSNSLKSNNPHSGIYETQIAKCLDTRCLEPSCNQGGMMICYSVDCRNLELNENRSGTLQAKESGGFSYNYLNPVLMENMNERQV